MKIGSRTPWGKADHVAKIADGIEFVSTPGHGGYKLNRKMNAKVHEAWRKPGGWYEEDCDYAIVHFTFPELILNADKASAVKVLKGYNPYAYMAVTGEKVTAEESHVLAEQEFKTANKDRFVAVAAWGEWHAKVPAGKVGIVATKAGARLPGVRERYFLVDAGRYGGRFGYVVDESVDTPWDGP